jgi:Cys-tRNA(Pro) deacylase
MKPAAERVAQALRAMGNEAQITEFAESTHTAEEAAAAVGAHVGQIVKSLVFLAGNEPILALVSGAHKVDARKLADVAGAPIKRADADMVRDATGYSIGGVPPLGLARQLRTYFDEALLQYPVVWAAAGTPNAVFPISPQQLARITDATVVSLSSET